MTVGYPPGGCRPTNHPDPFDLLLVTLDVKVLGLEMVRLGKWIECEVSLDMPASLGQGMIISLDDRVPEGNPGSRKNLEAPAPFVSCAFFQIERTPGETDLFGLSKGT